MSILQKALKKAESERAALRRAETETSTHEPALERVSAAASPRRSRWVMIFAVVGAVGVGYGLHDLRPPVSPMVPVVPEPAASASVQARALPAMRSLADGDPLPLQLDRGVESLHVRAR